MSDNAPKILVEFSAEELSWLADRLHEMRGQWTSAIMTGASVKSSSPKIAGAIAQIEEHKAMEARLRNRLVDKAFDQGFGHL